MAEIQSVAEEGSTDVGVRLRAARAKVGMTRRQLATASGMSERYLAHIEAGTGNPTVAVLEALAGALDMAPAELLPLGGERSEARAAAAATLRRLPESRLGPLLDQMAQLGGANSSKGRRIVLLGMRGAGKSSLGKALALRLRVPFLEMSKEVEIAYGGEMRLLIELGGQSALRRYEHEAWETLIAEHESAVIATPGGIAADPVLFDRLLATAHSIWLEASPDDHMQRVMAQGDFRPMASNRGAMEDLKAILQARASEYARAEAQLDTSAQDFEGTVDRLEQMARRLIA
ncbi:XRE family aerobic/anaerobic benzoate catabolism transcriptional regulator [Sphingomonas vulcanisoli]|uniref:Shikimate kinase n=1 Tax=Sphingomonas vulcanisoli TaxID=1658060 RepID=A0ABX0TX28_9SPHN|nr:shikimate kinase [Sphingomonas vulcanisoli]NIJ09269.1 XRE family aerobic/anaerobic benzoate catabolism transcriptional regulator [Sphingomonas vulcanisoli]